MLALLKNIFTDKEVWEINGPAPGDAKPEVGGLNFTSAIESHLRWKTRLTRYIAGKNRKPLDPDVVACDDRCVLGQWIYDTGGQSFGNEPGFAELRETHARFHQCAAEVIRKVDAGQRDEAQQMLDSGDYARASMLVVRLLSSLWNRVR